MNWTVCYSQKKTRYCCQFWKHPSVQNSIYLLTSPFVHSRLVTVFPPRHYITVKPQRQSLKPKTQMLAPSTDKTHFTATVQSTGLNPHKEAHSNRHDFIKFTSWEECAYSEGCHYSQWMGISVACLVRKLPRKAKENRKKSPRDVINVFTVFTFFANLVNVIFSTSAPPREWMMQIVLHLTELRYFTYVCSPRQKH